MTGAGVTRRADRRERRDHAPGLNSTLDGDLPGGYDLVVMANLDPPAAENVARMVRGWLGARD